LTSSDKSACAGASSPAPRGAGPPPGRDSEPSGTRLKEFVYAVSHDLQRPIRQARSFAELIARHLANGSDSELSRLAGHVERASAEAQAMLDGLLRIARVWACDRPPAPVDCNALLESVRRRMAPVLEAAGGEIEQSPLPVLSGDPAQLGDLLACLLDNAVKFRAKDRPPRIRVSAAERNGEYLFAVSDNGIGIDPARRDRIFAVFQRLHTAREYPGLGAGLALCRAIVERHGGRLWVESEPGRGACFYFTIPAQPAMN